MRLIIHRINLRNNITPESKESNCDLQMSRKMSEATSEGYHRHGGTCPLSHVQSRANSGVSLLQRDSIPKKIKAGETLRLMVDTDKKIQECQKR